jgi:hypothetical protein
MEQAEEVKFPHRTVLPCVGASTVRCANILLPGGAGYGGERRTFNTTSGFGTDRGGFGAGS